MKKSKGRNYKYKKLSTAKRKRSKQILPALAAVSGACGLATAPASALELGDIKVDSHLGQPLRASIAYALSPNEQVFDHCIFLNRGSTANGMPAVSSARITITDTAIILNGRTPIREPLMVMRLSVNCPYTARLARDYTLMIDPAPLTAGEPVALGTDELTLTPMPDTRVSATELPVAARPTPVARSRPRPQDESPIAASSRYLVQPGDSLSQIVARIENRSIALWPAVDAIFAANPHAFLDNDRNLLKAGSWLDIPDMTSLPAVATADSSPPLSRQVPTSEPVAAYDGATISDTVPETVPVTEITPPVETVAEAELFTEPMNEPLPVVEPAEPVAPVTVPQLRPGDVLIGTDNPFVVPVGSGDGVIDIPDSELQGPQVSQPVPAVAVQNPDDGGTSGAWSWLLWLGGAGVAIILALLMFGRQIRERFGSVAVGVAAIPQRRRDDAPAARPSIADIDFNFDADTLTSKTISLDADLEAGTGLDDSAEMDVAQDFGYSATATEGQIDLEITEHAAREVEQESTDIIPPQHQDLTDSTVLHEEILPSDDDDDEEDYDVSMNVDATKHILDDNTATTKDLQAVLVDTDIIDDDDTSEYTLNKDVDYQILEQDYEDELTATQALNKEIEEAARALAEQMEEAEAGDETREMPTPQDPEVTAELTANLEAPGDAENEEFTDGSIPDLMVEMPVADSDATLDVESPTIEAEKKEAS